MNEKCHENGYTKGLYYIQNILSTNAYKKNEIRNKFSTHKKMYRHPYNIIPDVQHKCRTK